MADALPTAYLNGEFVPIGEARISPMDRGFLFGDAVYEVVPAYQGRAMLLDAHLMRLEHNLQELGITGAGSIETWRKIVDDLIGRNGGGDLAVYVQISRGTDTGRDHGFPDGITPTTFGMATPITNNTAIADGVSAITLPDDRWARCDIKSTALLANVLARQRSLEVDAADAILIREGEVTEASTSSVIIVENGTLITRGHGHELLPGTTRQLVLDLARDDGLDYREEPVSEERLRAADEIWLLSATRGVVPVTKLDGATVGDGQPGPTWRRTNNLFQAYRSALATAPG